MPLQRGTACLQCRRRKLRCDGQKPTCSPCMKHGREASCLYEETRSWGRHRQLQLKIGELQNQLELALNYLHLLTTAQCQSSETSPVAQTTPSSPTSDMSDSHDGHAIASGSQTYPTQFAPEPLLSTIPSGHLQLKVSAEWQDTLLKAFLPHAIQFHVDLDAKQIMSRAQGPPHSFPHDAFLNSMFLIGSRFDGIDLSPRHEARFRQRAQESLRLPTICQSDQRDCIRAACLLAGYFYATDCLSEAQQHISVASHLASSLSLESPSGGVSPEDDLLLQQVYTIDRLIMAYLGAGELSSAELFAVSGANLEGSFQTRLHFINAWTVTLEACLVPGPMKSSYSPSEMELLDRKAFSALRARAADLLWIASRSTHKPPSNQTLELTATEGVNFDMTCVIEKLQTSLPCQTQQTVMKVPNICLYTLVYASALQILQGDLLYLREVCDSLVDELIALIRELWDHDYKILEPIMGLCWQWLVEHLLDRIHRQDEHTGQLCELIKFTLLAMNKLAWELPVVCVNIANVTARCSEWGIYPTS